MGSVLPSGVLWGMQGRASSWHSQLLAPLSPSASVSSALIPLGYWGVSHSSVWCSCAPFWEALGWFWGNPLAHSQVSDLWSPQLWRGQGGICRNTFYLVETAKTQRRLKNYLTLQNNLSFFLSVFEQQLCLLGVSLADAPQGFLDPAILH